MYTRYQVSSIHSGVSIGLCLYPGDIPPLKICLLTNRRKLFRPTVDVRGSISGCIGTLGDRRLPSPSSTGVECSRLRPSSVTGLRDFDFHTWWAPRLTVGWTTYTPVCLNKPIVKQPSLIIKITWNSGKYPIEEKFSMDERDRGKKIYRDYRIGSMKCRHTVDRSRLSGNVNVETFSIVQQFSRTGRERRWDSTVFQTHLSVLLCKRVYWLPTNGFSDIWR